MRLSTFRDEEFVLPSKDDELKKAKPAKKVEAPKKSVKPAAAKTVKPDAAKPESPKVVVKSEAPLGDAAADGVPAEAGKASRSLNLNIKSMRGTIIKVAALAVALIAVVVIVFGVLIYAYHSENPAVKAVASVVPYPVERINGHFITYKEYMFQVDSEKLAQQSNAKLNNQPAVDFNSSDGKKLVTQIKQHALLNLEHAAVVEQLAAQKHVKVTDKQLNEALDKLVKANGNKESVLKTIQNYYGWNWNDLRMVLKKQLLEKNLSEKVMADPAADTAAKTKAANLVKDIKGGLDFGEAAKKSSQASDASTGGDLGFFTKGQIPDELQKVADGLAAGQISDPVKDAYGYEIIKVVEKKEDGSIHGQHILIETIDFASYLKDQIGKAKINKYIKA